MNIEIKEIGITTFQGNTWGRVHINYTKDGSDKYAFKNHIYGKENNFSGEGLFQNDPAFTQFKENEITHDYLSVLEGEYDYMYLTPEKYQSDSGTPSKILMSLIEDIDSGLLRDINERRGWYKK